MRQLNKISGSALLTALFTMTLVAIVATAMSARIQADIYRTRLIIAHDQLYLATQAVTFWAFSELNIRENQFTQAKQKGMIANFPKNLAAIYPGVNLSGALFDLQARFNLNNLNQKTSIISFLNFINHAYPNMPNLDKAVVALSLKDWLSHYDLARGKDSYTDYYLQQIPPYYPSHQLLRSASEFRLIKEVNAKTYLALEPYITALPETTPINLNTAPLPVLMSLGNGLSKEQIEEVIAARGKDGIKNLNDINELLNKIALPRDQITVDSQYFLAIAQASSEVFNLVVYTVLKRSINRNGKITVRIIQESLNVN